MKGKYSYTRFDGYGFQKEAYFDKGINIANRWDEVESTFAVDYGVPVKDAVELGRVGSGVFFREYSKMNLTFDCAKQTADYAFFKK